MRTSLYTILFVMALLGWQSSAGTAITETPFHPRIQPAPPEPDMPDISHALLAEHAAQSHDLPADQVAWLSQGAWDEDHCSTTLYPPGGPLCVPGIPNGHHSWDPDNNLFWNEPAWWGDFGPGLSHAVYMFGNAVNAYQAGNDQAAYLWLGRALHLVGDVATPAHVHLDSHLPFDPDSYENWLAEADYSNTQAWIELNPAGPGWDYDFHDLPGWDELDPELQASLDAASQLYGGRASGQALWEQGPQGEDRIIFQVMYLVAEEADNFDSDDVPGERYPGDLSDPLYLAQIRERMFPLLVRHSAALIAYFEALILPPPPPGLISPDDGAWVETARPVFTWQPVGVDPSYSLEITVEPGSTNPLIRAQTNQPTYTPSSTLAPGSYYWRVQAETQAGSGSWSETWQFITPWKAHLPFVVSSGNN